VLIASPSVGDVRARTLKGEHALVPRLDGEPIGFLAGFRSLALPPPGSDAP
jgi:hypothetical protein